MFNRKTLHLRSWASLTKPDHIDLLSCLPGKDRLVKEEIGFVVVVEIVFHLNSSHRRFTAVAINSELSFCIDNATGTASVDDTIYGDPAVHIGRNVFMLVIAPILMLLYLGG
ncbi:hypothetical protein ACJX0J_017499 [Zea mays]